MSNGHERDAEEMDEGDECRGGDSAVPDAPADASPVCPHCMEPLDGLSLKCNLTYYCPHCSEPVNHLVASIPFVNIPYQVDFAAKLWRKAWRPGASLALRGWAFLIFISNYPFIFLGTPSALLARFRASRAR